MRDPEFDTPAKALEPEPTDRLDDWLRARERSLIAAAVSFQLLILAGMIVEDTTPWVGRSTVLLRVMPVDPRDLMRGDYVTLGYDISRVPPGGVRGASEGRTVYVALVPEQDGRHFRGTGATLDPPASGRFIRGTLAPGDRIVFGIESYYVQEGKGLDYENAVRTRRLSAEVALAPDGRAALRRLVFD